MDSAEPVHVKHLRWLLIVAVVVVVVIIVTTVIAVSDSASVPRAFGWVGYSPLQPSACMTSGNRSPSQPVTGSCSVRIEIKRSHSGLKVSGALGSSASHLSRFMNRLRAQFGHGLCDQSWPSPIMPRRVASYPHTPALHVPQSERAALLC